VTTLAPEYPLLGLLLAGPSHGYALQAKLQADLGELWNISLSQTYNILKRLEESSLIQGTLQQQRTKPDRYELHLTPAGREHFMRWLLEPSIPSSQLLRVEFLTRLYFARRHRPALLETLVTQQVHQIEVAINNLEKRLLEMDGSSRANRWALQIRIVQTQSFLDWLRQNEANLILPINSQEDNV
jgi:DNA-binding PadR family transcriptional regulator